MKYYRLILVTILVVSLLLLGIESIGSLTGKATVATPSKITVNKYISMSFSNELESGVIFEDINFLPANNVNADKNYNLTNQTEYYVMVANDANSEMDLCIRATSDLTNFGMDKIGIGNETYSYSLKNNETLPNLLNETGLTFGYAPAGTNIPLGGQNNIRFWLDVPAGQAPGTYNNSLYFKGMATGEDC